ncbi:hypothetical protein Taro_042593 [Colocasia esculenta]|uniref:Uncharacterized protein n=1 Tax=Colocasia esculenta TaxID=4460 RepID=A0A843WPZ6_COLES|nr:hypothetical protein [Colocasia esculenta]
MGDAPVQGEQSIEKEAAMVQREQNANAPIDDMFREGPSGPSEELQQEEEQPSGPCSAGPSGPLIAEQQQEEERPSGPLSENPAGPPGPILVENELIEQEVAAKESRPAGPAEDASPLVESMAVREEDQDEAPEPLVLPSIPTPAPPSPPTSSTAPPTHITFKRPRSRNISSPAPFSSQPPSSPPSSSIIPPPLSSVAVPPASTSEGASSSGPSFSSGPSDLPLITPASLFQPQTPPSFITIIPEGAQLAHTEIQDIKDEFEVAILRSVLAVGTHSHRIGSSSPIPKKRRLTSTHPVSSEPCYPPLWFSLSIINKQKSLYEEFLQKVVFAHLFGLPFQPLSAHPNTIFPYAFLSKAQQSKIFSMTEAKTEEQWAQSDRDLYNHFCRTQAARYPPREAHLSLSEWFQIHHKSLFGPFIQKEIKFIRQYKMYCDYCYLHNIPEVQLGQFRQAIHDLSSRVAHTQPLRVDFSTLVIPDVVFLPPLHSLIMDSSVGTLMFEWAAQVMARLSVQEGRNLAFHRFVFKQYLQGYLKADVLAPILSECERLSPADWEKLYTLSAQQLKELNTSQARSHKPLLTLAKFLDANSLHLVRDSFLKWEERYKVITISIEL